MQGFVRQEPIFSGGRDGRRVGAGAIRADPIGREQGLVLQHLAEEALGGPQVARGGEQEIDRRAVLVDSPVQVSPLAADLMYVSSRQIDPQCGLRNARNRRSISSA